MAERDEKIFPALPQRRQRAREQGQIARSNDLTAAASFAAAALALSLLTAAFGRFSVGAFKAAMSAAGAGDPAVSARAIMWPLTAAVVATFALGLASVAGAAVQGGLVFAPARVGPDLSRLSPARYFGRVFSSHTLFELCKSSTKILLVGWVAWLTARHAFELYAADGGIANGLGILQAGLRQVLGLSAIIGLAMGAADYGVRRYEHERELRMTRQEFLDELKQEEGNPQVKRAIRRAQRRHFRRARGIHQAAAATVVLTNPTRFAVALRYRRGFDRAPLVVAKGAGEAAVRLIAIARLAAVPVLENKPLARALFRITEVGDYIPRQFYRAIAEVLALVLRSQAQAQGRLAKVA